MKTLLLQRVYLCLSGLVALAIGATLLFRPELLHAGHGVDVRANASLASEVRAPGAALLGLGVLVLSGAASPTRARMATTVSAVVYLTYGLGRLVSLAADGAPSPDLIVAMAVEFGIGALALPFLLRRAVPAAGLEPA